LRDLFPDAAERRGPGRPPEARRMVTPLPGPEVDEEMITLFARGLKLLEEGADEEDEECNYLQPEKHYEFAEVRKRLEWDLLHIVSCCGSVFNPEVEGPPRDYMLPHANQVHDWNLYGAWRRALKAALDERNKRR
jgi:hypothetical protein